MAAGKYGRLFTEADVKLLLRYAAHRGQELGVEGLGRDRNGNRVDPGARVLAEYDAHVGTDRGVRDVAGRQHRPDQGAGLMVDVQLLRWRCGRVLGHTVYAQVHNEPSHDDVFLCTTHPDSSLAQHIVDNHNAAIGAG